jgi:hypothetical protein
VDRPRLSKRFAVALLAGQLVDGHLHLAPHGGVISHAGPYHLETVVDEGWIAVWLLDRRMRPVAPGTHTLAATIRLSQRPPQTVAFGARGDHFRAEVDLAGLPTLAVEMRLDASKHARARASFRWTALDARQRLLDGVDL